jgi:iron-sulfur cluster repair protein YtfE (RIC family)
MAQFVRTMREMFWGGVTPDKASIERMREFLTQALPQHFQHEEQHIFPALEATTAAEKASHGTAGLVGDHRVLLEDAQKLLEMLAKLRPDRSQMGYLQQGLDTSLLGALYKSMMEFVGKLERHSAEEDKLMPPSPSRASTRDQGEMIKINPV